MSTTANQMLSERNVASSQEPSNNKKPRDHESGYTVAMTALLLIPLLVFAAFATDVGSWYIKADQAQSGADAAALAGAVWLPDVDKATLVALDVAARNGFRDPRRPNGDGQASNATVRVVEDQGNLQVDIETKAPSYLGRIVLDEVSIERRAKATAVSPVRMGNPSNFLGTGNLDSSEIGAPPDGAWLSIAGWCRDHRFGDPFSTGYYGAPSAAKFSFWACRDGNNRGPNPTYNPNAYNFVVDIPPGAGQIELEIFEPGGCRDQNNNDKLYSANEEKNQLPAPRINVRVFANDSTPNYHKDNLARTPVKDILYGADDCTGGVGEDGRWYPIHTVPAGAANEGRWYIHVGTQAVASETHSNRYALRARRTGNFKICSSQNDPLCPELYALEWMSTHRPNYGGDAFKGQEVELFMASIPEEHAGKTVEIKLFDPGEGNDNMQFLDPHGNPVEFKYRLANCSVGLICTNNKIWPENSTFSPNQNCSGNPCLKVTKSRYQDRWLYITTELPADYECAPDCWWRVKYRPQANRAVDDHFTWSVGVTGGPLHLVG